MKKPSWAYFKFEDELGLRLFIRNETDEIKCILCDGIVSCCGHCDTWLDVNDPRVSNINDLVEITEGEMFLAIL